MKRLLVVLAVICFAAVGSVFASSANYLKVLGGGIIVDQENLDPFNPAGVQFTPNFARLELKSPAGAAAGVTNQTTGGAAADVMFTFPLVVNYKFNNMAGIRIKLFDSADANIGIPGSLTPVNILGITYAIKLNDTTAIGLMYQPEVAFDGKYSSSNIVSSNAYYINNKLTPGIVTKVGNITVNAFAPIGLLLANMHSEAINAGGGTNDVSAGFLNLVGLTVQASTKLSEQLLGAVRVESAYKINNIITKTSTATNNALTTFTKLNLIAGLKIVPVQLIDVYADIGAKYYGYYLRNEGAATNSDAASQFSFPSLAVGVNVKPGDFRIKLGFTQDLVATSSYYAGLFQSLNTDWELDSSATGSLAGGNTKYTLVRNASAGLSYETSAIQIDTILNITTTGFIGRELGNPLDVLDAIFNNAADMANLFTGVRVSVLF